MQKYVRSWSYALVGLSSFAVYWTSAYPTINWWDSSSYSLASSKLAVVGPPGSLVLTLLGWPLTQLFSNSSLAHALNVFAGVLASLSMMLVYAVSLRVLKLLNSDIGIAAQLGAAFGTLALAFSTTLWDYSIQFTPYILTTVFTGMVLWRMLRWWEDAEQLGSWKHFAWLGLLIGVDFSVHRTNALLAPSVLVWVVVRDAKTLLNWRVWVSGASTMIAAFLLQMLLIPMSGSAHSLLNWNDTSTFKSLWSFISLKQYGGGFLVSFWPRNAPFWSSQVGDVAKTFAENFLHWSGPSRILGVGATLVGLCGMAVMWRRDKRFGFAFTMLLFLQAAMTILYFNIPAHFFRSLNRHYLPICITFGIAIAIGAAVIADSAAVVLGSWNSVAPKVTKRMLAVVGALLVISLPVIQLVDNWKSRDASSRYFAFDYANNSLSELPPNAIYFTAGDNDTYPILYLQDVQGIRRDVTLVNLSLLVDPTYAKRLVREDSTLPIPTTRTLHDAAKPDWTDSTLADVVRLNAGRRPITFAITSAGSIGGFKRFTRLDGLHYRVMPQAGTPIVLDSLRANLFRLEYRGLADSTVFLDNDTRRLAVAYVLAFDALLEADSKAASNNCVKDRAKLMQLIAPQRVDTSAAYAKQLASQCH
ncbi:MAG: DUF2723 domain-containing protein [Gemmatimonadaceae bacterium]